MKEDIKLLNKYFKKIKHLGWIKSKRKGTTGIGYTFEYLINKKEDKIPLPDFGKIEIKSKHYFSKGNITLFNATPNHTETSSIKYIIKEYGYPSKIYKGKKVFNISIYADRFIDVGWYKKFKLHIDKNNNKIVLVAINRGNIDTSITWSLESIKEKIKTKIQYLAIPYAKSKIINGEEYLKFKKIEIYELKDINTFIKLLENGKIRITFKIGIFTSGAREGSTHDHGTGFDINKKDLLLLYKKIL